MKFVTLCLVLVVAAFGAVGLAAQDKPNFSGTWIGVGPQQLCFPTHTDVMARYLAVVDW